MRTIFWIALGGVAVYLLSKKSEGTAPAAVFLTAPNLPAGIPKASATVPTHDELCARWIAYSQSAADPNFSVAAWVGPVPQNCPVPSSVNLIQSGQWGCPAGQVFDSGANICVPGVSVAPAYPGGPV